MYENTDAFLICFDITNRESFGNAAGKWTNEIRKYNNERNMNVPFLLIGCKSDLRERRNRDDRSISLEEDRANLLVHGYCRKLFSLDVIGECFRFYYDQKSIKCTGNPAQASPQAATMWIK